MATAQELAELVGGRVEGDSSVVVTGAAGVEDAGPEDVVLAENTQYFEAAVRSQAAAIVCSNGETASKTLIRVDDSRLAFARILGHFAPDLDWPVGIDANCHTGKGLRCGSGVGIGFGCYVGDEVTLGDGVVLGPQVYVGNGVSIGSGSVLWPRATVHWGTEIGERVTIHSGAVIGTDGFGYVRVGETHTKIPQIGKVVIEDDVEIGANVTIDRAKTGRTRIGRGTKIDNLVMVAHNVEIGENCLIIAQSGLAGSVSVGDGVTIAAQAGIKEHVRISDNAVIMARAGIMNDVPPAAVMAGLPARERVRYWRIAASLDRLPELTKSVRKLEEKLEGQGQL